MVVGADHFLQPLTILGGWGKGGTYEKETCGLPRHRIRPGCVGCGGEEEQTQQEETQEETTQAQQVIEESTAVAKAEGPSYEELPEEVREELPEEVKQQIKEQQK